MMRALILLVQSKRLLPFPDPPANEHGNFHPLPEWKPGQPKPPNWPPHIHLPKEVSRG